MPAGNGTAGGEATTSDRAGLGAPFLLVWGGQLISMLGSRMSGFALAMWIYQTTGSVTRLAIISLLAVLPGVVAAPLLGVIVDRWDRRHAMLLGDLGAGGVTIVLAWLFSRESVPAVPLYLAMGAIFSFAALHGAAYAAAVTQLVAAPVRARANGLIELAEGVTSLLSPVLSGVLLSMIGISGVLVVDAATYVVGVLMLVSVTIPRPAASQDGATKTSFRDDIAYGFRYLGARPGLLSLLGLFACINFALGLVQVLTSPLLLSFTSTRVTGLVLSATSLGVVAGGIAASVRRGPTRHVRAILRLTAVEGLLLAVAGLRPSALLIALAGFAFLFFLPQLSSHSQTIWQARVAPDVQGRVFAARRALAATLAPLAYLVSGPLADRVFEPLLAPSGALASTVGQVIGVGPGRGMGLLFIVLGLLVATAAAVFAPFLRLEDASSAGVEA